VTEHVEFTVYGVAQPGGSKKWLPRGGRPGARPLLVDDNPRAKDWQRAVALQAGGAMGGRALFTGPLLLRLRFVVVRPGGHYTSTGKLSAHGRRHPYPDKRPDLTKLVRAVEDGLKGVVWRDDDQVVQQEAAKVYGEPARVEVEVGPALPPLPYDGDPQLRLDRLENAIGPEHAESVAPGEQLRAVLRLIEQRDRCRCGATYDPLVRRCEACGRATFTQYPAKRAAGVPLEPEQESLQIARSA
jgi:Holliday junction resolvase RusA-like endonuclease